MSARPSPPNTGNVIQLPRVARGWKPERADCEHCGSPLALDYHPYASEGQGVRAFRCGLCQGVTRYYSAAWL